MPIVGDFSGQSPLRGFYEEFFPDKTPSAGSDGGLSGKFPPETSPPRHTHYSPVSLERTVSGCLLVLSSAPLAPNEERFIHGGEAMWIKRSCTEPRWDCRPVYYGDCKRRLGRGQKAATPAGGGTEPASRVEEPPARGIHTWNTGDASGRWQSPGGTSTQSPLGSWESEGQRIERQPWRAGRGS